MDLTFDLDLVTFRAKFLSGLFYLNHKWQQLDIWLAMLHYPIIASRHVNFDIWPLTVALWLKVENVGQGHFANFGRFDLCRYQWTPCEPQSTTICKFLTFDLWPWRGDLELYVFEKSCLGDYSATITQRRFTCHLWHHYDMWLCSNKLLCRFDIWPWPCDF